MLSVIFGKKSDHPLAELKSVQALLDDMPKNDAHRALLEISDLVETLKDSSEFKLDHEFAVLRMLDDAAQPYVRKLVKDYFTPFEINKVQENRMWLMLNKWFNLVSGAYIDVFGQYDRGEKGAGAIKSQAPLLSARTVHTLMWKLKLISAHYGKVEDALWSNLLQVYKHAEQNQYLDATISLYPGAAANTTVKCELGHMMIWYDAGLSALSPLYIHLTERIVAQYGSTIEISTRAGQQSRLCFDLNQPGVPTRVNAAATTHPSMRFVGLPEMRAKLEELMKVLNKDIVPTDINLGGTYEAGVIKEAAQYLLSYIIAPPVRRSARRAADVSLSVVSGFDNVMASADAMLGFDAVTKALWVTEEISVTGFSSRVPFKGSEGIGIGSLLGYQPEGVPHWGVAVVRRLIREDDMLRVGAEILSSQVISVTLNENKVAGGAIENGQPALWLCTKQNDKTGEIQLLMRADTFSPGRSLQIVMNGKIYLLIPSGLQEKGLDYDLAKFRFAIQEAASTSEAG